MTFEDYVHLLLLISAQLNFVQTSSSSSDTTAVALTDPPSQTLSCPSDQFACLDGKKCIKRSWLNDCKDNCDDASDETPDAQCFQCADGSKSVKRSYLCDGFNHCDDASDESGESVCLECAADPSNLICERRGLQNRCIRKEDQCDGFYRCDDFSDESPSLCDNCSRPGLARCRDGSMCVATKFLCNGVVGCADGSDESDTWSNCTFCTEKIG